jgi:Fic family protein
MNILYLVTQGLLDLPILYLSRYVIQHKLEYYNLLQKVRDTGEWEEWLLYMLKGVEKTAEDTIVLVKKIVELMQQFKQALRPLLGRSYRHDLLNNLFSHPYTKIPFVQENLQVNRNTAAKYLDTIIEAGLIKKVKYGTTNYYLNMPLIELFVGESQIQEMSDEEIIESITDDFSYAHENAFS